jgi:hypothetical protein
VYLRARHIRVTYLRERNAMVRHLRSSHVRAMLVMVRHLTIVYIRVWNVMVWNVREMIIWADISGQGGIWKGT